MPTPKLYDIILKLHARVEEVCPALTYAAMTRSRTRRRCASWSIHDVRFACAYELFIQALDFEGAVFLRRTENTDELWIVVGESLPTVRRISDGTASPQDFERGEYFSVGRVFAIKRKGEELTACLKLMELLFRATYGFEHPEKFIAPGIVDKSAYDRLLKRLDDEHEENRRKAREGETEIIKVARELGFPRNLLARVPVIGSPGVQGRSTAKLGIMSSFIDAAEDCFRLRMVPP